MPRFIGFEPNAEPLNPPHLTSLIPTYLTFQIAAAAVLATVALGDKTPPPPPPPPAYHPAPAYKPAPPPAYKPAPYHEPAPVPPKYAYEYAVKDDYSSANFGHSETRDGYATSGSYRVALPDGRVQIVTYRADENGYVADVKYEGEAQYPEYKPKPAYKPAPPPAYKPAPPPPAYKPAPPTYKPAPATL